MKTEQYDIKTNIEIGKQIFENQPNDIRPGWAGLILSRFDTYIKDIPTSILELYPIIDNKDRWKENDLQNFDAIAPGFHNSITSLPCTLSSFKLLLTNAVTFVYFQPKRSHVFTGQVVYSKENTDS